MGTAFIKEKKISGGTESMGFVILKTLTITAVNEFRFWKLFSLSLLIIAYTKSMLSNNMKMISLI